MAASYLPAYPPFLCAFLSHPLRQQVPLPTLPKPPSLSHSNILDAILRCQDPIGVRELYRTCKLDLVIRR